MAYQPLHEEFPELAERETRTIIVTDAYPSDDLPEGAYTLHELYCNDRGCDCRRVMLNVQASFRRGPEAVVAWGWESREFYARWMGDDDETALDQVQGPCLNLGSPETELARPLLALVTEVLTSDEAYGKRIQDHYRIWRAHVDGPRGRKRRSPGGWFDTPSAGRR